MSKIQAVDTTGMEHELEIEPGMSLMEVLCELDHGVAAMCGGCCSCATCHIFVDPQWVDLLPAPASDERDLLVEMSGYNDQSRLSCQVIFEPSLSGLKVTVAPDN